MMFSDEAIDVALESLCDTCGASAGLECMDLGSWIPLIEVTGCPVHDGRIALREPLNRYEQDLEAGGAQ